MLRISLQEFARSGSLGSIKPGTCRSDVMGFFGQPSDWGLPPTTIDAADIWKYGDFEIHFLDDSVWMIFTDYFDVPRGGDTIDIDPWILRSGLDCADLQNALNASDISFTSQPNRHNVDETDIITIGRVYFTFREKDNEFGPSGLCAFHTDTANA